MDIPREIRRTNRRTGSAAAMLISIAFLAGACSSGTTTSSASGGSARTGALAYSECMRSHGIRDFPDPSSNGGFAMQGKPGSDLNPNNPQFRSAANACQSLAPKAPPGQPAQLRAEGLKYSQCMRAHGIKDFPDPNSEGQIILGKPGQNVGNLDPGNPQYQTAATACRQYQPGGQGGAPAGGSQGNGGS